MSLGDLVQQGGWTMLPIYFCSIVALAVFIKKLFEIRSADLSNLGWVDKVLSAVRGGDYPTASEACKGPAHPASRVVEAVLKALERRPDRAEAEARRVGSLEIQALEKNLTLLSFIAQVAPLLGLLGTVLGMVDLFIGLQGAGLKDVDVSALSSGIWKALLTTAAGLLVAVPTLAGYSFLASRTDKLRLQLSDVGGRVITESPIPAEFKSSEKPKS